jgi:lysophospholipase L1-like esterase
MSGSPGSLPAAFAGLPPGLRARPLVLGGKPAKVLVSTARRAGAVLIIGAGRRDAALAIAAIIALVGCGSSVTSSARHSSAPRRPAWHLVTLGDSLPFGQQFCGGCRTFADLFGAGVQRMAGVRVAVQNLSQDTGIDSRDLRREIASSASMRSAVAHADIVTLTIGHNDTPWNSLDDPCDGKGGYSWARYHGTCLQKTAAAFRGNVNATLAAIVALRKGRPTAIRITNDYNDLIGDPATPRSAYPTVRHVVEVFAAISCSLATQYRAVCADTYHAFNGAHGLRDAGPLLAPDHTHPSQRGHNLIAALLLRTGWAPLHR